MRGFHNIGNTCYFNTSLQCLLQIQPLSNHFIRHGYTGSCEFTRAYTDLVHRFWSTGHEAFDVRSILAMFEHQFPRFTLGQQHDVQETILCIIDILERSIPEVKSLFYGKKTQETVYPGGKKTHEEDFSVHLVCSMHGKDFETMFRESLQWNTLVDYVDDAGKTHHVATTRNALTALPHVFMVSFDKKSFISLAEYIEMGGLKYRLLAVAAHVGVQCDGHYVAFTRHKDQWYYKNDDVVEAVNLPREGGFYFLIYTKQ